MADTNENPTSPADALGWAKAAAANGRYIVDDHYFKRCQQRRISPRAWRQVLATAKQCLPYVPDRGPLAGGTSWRIIGEDFEGEETTIGVETYVDRSGGRVLIITVF